MAQVVKRMVDIAVACLLLAAFSPLMAFEAIAVFVSMGRPIFFRQVRPGYLGKPFVLVKFRTMRDEYDALGQPLPEGQRLTGLGVFLRRASLDELPQLWNVLRGELSLVGPRPLLMEYLPRYSPEQTRRHLVKPGITGWAQVNGRNAVDWDTTFARDVWYVDHFSLWLDAKILALTAVKVVSRGDTTGQGMAPTVRVTFQGSGEGRHAGGE